MFMVTATLQPDLSTISMNAVDDTAMTTMNASTMSAVMGNSSKRRRSSDYETLLDSFDMASVKGDMCFDGYTVRIHLNLIETFLCFCVVLITVVSILSFYISATLDLTNVSDISEWIWQHWIE